MDLESGKSEISENKHIWADRWCRLSSVIGKIFTQRIAYAPFFLMVCLIKFLHKKDVSFCEILVASYFNHPPQMQLSGNPPQLQMMQQRSSVQKNGNPEPTPHHTLIGSGPVPGTSNQVVSFNAQNQQGNLPATDYFLEVFQCDPQMLPMFQGNPRQLNLNLQWSHQPKCQH